MMRLAANQEFQFLILNIPEHWHRGYSENLEVSDAGLQLQSNFEFVPENQITGDQLLSQLEEVDLTVGDCSQLYLLEIPKKQIWIFDAPQRRLEPVSCLEGLFTNPTNIAYSPSTIYVADDRQASGETVLFAFARLNWQIRWQIKIEGKAQDLIADRSGNLYVLLETADPVIAKFAPSGTRLQSSGFARGNIQKPQAIAIAPDNSVNPRVYVLDTSANAKVISFKLDGTDPTAVIESSDFPSGMQPSGLTVDRFGDLYIGDSRTFANNQAENRFIYRFHLVPPNVKVEPVLGYRGATDKLIIDSRDRLYVFNKETKQVSVLKQESRFRRLDPSSPPSGIFYSGAFDSTTIKQRWHKLVLDSTLPANTQIQVSYVTAEKPEEKAQIEAKLSNPSQRNEIQWSDPPLVNPRDALILEKDPLRILGTDPLTLKEIAKPGRYLWLRVTLIGTDKTSPVVKSIRVDFPRLSYLRYLPATYQENEQSRDFLERFLSLFETSFRNVEQQIDHIARYFDGDTDVVVGDYLRWLASWLAIAAEDAWTDAQIRQLLKQAPQLYQQRGTRAGLEGMIQIFTGDRPLIVEHFQWQCAQEPELRDLLARLYGNDPFCFCVLLKPFQTKTPEQRQTIHRLIDADKPAHTCAGLHQLQPWVYLDMHTYLGINTYLSPPTPRLDGSAALGRDTVLTDTDEAGQIERRSRLGQDTTLT